MGRIRRLEHEAGSTCRWNFLDRTSVEAQGAQADAHHNQLDDRGEVINFDQIPAP
jgi:hypothetical protein